MDRITDRLEILNADCYTLLDAWSSDAALVTDPPYGIGYVHSGGGNGVVALRHFAKPEVSGVLDVDDHDVLKRLEVVLVKVAPDFEAEFGSVPA